MQGNVSIRKELYFRQCEQRFSQWLNTLITHMSKSLVVTGFLLLLALPQWLAPDHGRVALKYQEHELIKCFSLEFKDL